MLEAGAPSLILLRSILNGGTSLTAAHFIAGADVEIQHSLWSKAAFDEWPLLAISDLRLAVELPGFS